jgi:hypothetical protein
MAKVSKVNNGIKKIKLTPQKANLDVTVVDYGFDKPTVNISMTNGITGIPIKGLKKSNVVVIAVQRPSGWAVKNKLKVSSLHNNADGVYTFTLSDNGNDLKKGRWTISIRTLKTEAKILHMGQALISFMVN